MFRFPTARLLRALPLASVVAALAACDDGPIGPPAPGAASAPAASTAPRRAAAPAGPVTALPPGYVHGEAYVVANGSVPAPGTMLAFTSDNKVVTVADNAEADLDSRIGYYRVAIPIATAASYRVEVLSAPATFNVNTSLRIGGGTLVNGVVSFSKLYVADRTRLEVTLLSTYKVRTPGATLVLKAGGMVAQTLTDGADWAWNGSTPAPDGVVTFYMDLVPNNLEVCEIAPPPGYLLPTVSCQPAKMKGTGPNRLTFFHQAGILAPPVEQ